MNKCKAQTKNILQGFELLKVYNSLIKSINLFLRPIFKQIPNSKIPLDQVNNWLTFSQELKKNWNTKGCTAIFIEKRICFQFLFTNLKIIDLSDQFMECIVKQVIEWLLSAVSIVDFSAHTVNLGWVKNVIQPCSMESPVVSVSRIFKFFGNETDSWCFVFHWYKMD